ncbi:MAG: amidohydrolase family protein [Candidatus Marinimicrobia bacterium]|jgi:imidazolonepropionase-like amidohydrolase|nr:amidohydrolase family protein [Candidatus Neomarinimicrobiota bacterium]MDP6593810.1 amidohydrolase family protein [Candidatus Neomarinimicrobiota bacterium]MDP6836129.1 amidohydrolase family protein [Candidatus Neomarinimicrobiota bacterium]|tara:strand:+ start:621 stop:3719 length:3099 start_codon:yes stop_codon:yes gene_type:complete
MNRTTLGHLIILAVLATQGIAQVEPVDPDQGLHYNTPRVFILKGAVVVTEPGKSIDKGEIVIRDGLIKSVGKVAKYPRDAVEIDLTGKTIYAGFVESYLTRDKKRKGGRGERPSEREPKKEEATATAHWNKLVRPDYRVLDEFVLEDKKLEELRKLGFTSAHLVPTEGIFRGRSAVIHLEEWSSGSVINEQGPVHLTAFEYGGWRDRSYPNSLLGSIALMRQTLINSDWYADAWKTYSRFPGNNEQPEVDRALEILSQHTEANGAFCFEAGDELAELRAGQIAKEFDLKLWLHGNGYEYRRLKEIAGLDAFVILPLNFPQTPDVETWEKSLQQTNAALRHWDLAPDNPRKMIEAGIPFALTSSELKDGTSFSKNLRRSVERGLSEKDALASLTTVPARYLGLEEQLGIIEEGKIANLTVVDGNYFEGESQVTEVWIQGNRHRLVQEPDEDLRGKWLMQWTYNDMMREDTLDVSGKKTKLKAKLVWNESSVDLKNIKIEINNSVSFLFDGDSLELTGIVRLSGSVKEDYAEGQGRTPDGKTIRWFARRTTPFEEKPEQEKPKKREEASTLAVRYPEGAFGLEAMPDQSPIVLVKNATIWTSGPAGIVEESDLLVKKGKIWKIGRNLKVSGSVKDAVVIDAKGRHITPGLIDCHSHTAASSINEGTQAVTAEVRIRDVLNSNDINLYRQLAGGLTTANVLHGSANPIGGQNAVIKLRWGTAPNDLLLKDAPQGIKFALGENVKQSNWGQDFTTRYPQTRMGVEQIIRDAFTAAREYQRKFDEHGGGKSKSLKKIPPRRDLELEALAEILRGERLVHSHSYRQDEILMLVRVAEDFGFRIGTFQHVLEGYKMAEALADHGAGGSTFTDWWGYKFEVIDAIPFNGALMQKVGVTTSYNSDDSELARRMNTEAAKAVKYGGISEEDALKFVTINPAVQLGIDEWVGSLEEGKDADFVIWSESPLSTFAVCEQTWIEGRNYFNLVKDQQMREEASRERNELIQKILASEDKSPGGKKQGGHYRPHLSHPYSCLEGVIQ